jgi:hypothetical protein
VIIFVTIIEIVDILKIIDPYKASGPDKISHKMVKISPEKIAIPLQIIFNKSIPSGKGKRLIVLHAVMRSEGLIDGCDLVFLAKSTDGDYHQEMNSFVFLEWFENQLMPALAHINSIGLSSVSNGGSYYFMSV